MKALEKLDAFLKRLAMKPKKPEEAGPRYADVYERAVAAGIDLWLLYIILSDLFYWITRRILQGADADLLRAAEAAPTMGEMLSLTWQSGLLHLWLLNATIQIVVIGFFVVGSQWIWSATPGKKLLGLQIVRVGTLEEVARWRLLVRYVGYIIAATPFMIGIIWASFNKQRRGWHDMLAGTVVIHTRPQGWYWSQLKHGYRWLREKAKGRSGPVE